MKRLIVPFIAATLLGASPSAHATDVRLASAPVEHAEGLGGGGGGLWVALAALALAIFLVADGGGSPDSP